MKRFIPLLSILLAIQVGFAIVLGVTGREFGAASPGEPLLEFDGKVVDRILIEEMEKEALVLEKKDDAWHLPGHHGFPASKVKVDGFTGQLAELQRRLPVAATEAAAKRFKVSGEAFERKVVLADGDETLAMLYLGDSPGFRRVYARADKGDAVFEVALASHEASIKASDWTDKTFLHLKEADVARAELPDVVLERKDEVWVLSDLKEGETTDEEEARRLVRTLAGLSFLEVLGTEAKPEYKQDSPVLSYSIGLSSGETVRYVISQPEDEKDYVLKVSTHPYFFKVANYTVEPLTELERSKLVSAEAAGESAEKSAAPTSEETTDVESGESPVEKTPE